MQLLILLALVLALPVGAAESWTATSPFKLCAEKPTGADASTVYDWRDERTAIITTTTINQIAIAAGPEHAPLKMTVRPRRGTTPLGPWSDPADAIAIYPCRGYGLDCDGNGSLTGSDVTYYRRVVAAGAKSCGGGKCPACQ